MRSFAVASLFASAVALVSSAFGGGVKEHVDAIKASGKPVVFAVDDHEYTCSSCEPPVKVRINTNAKVTGHSEYDELQVAVRSPTNIEVVEELNGKHQAYYNYTVSADGKTLNVAWSDWSGPKIVKGGYTATRVGPAPPGAHAASGSWKIEKTMEDKSYNK
jgi:hypothetical protein